MPEHATRTSQFLLTLAGLDALLQGLRQRGYRLIGPVVRDGVIAYEELQGAGDLPKGWTDRQQAASYRLERRADEALFGYAVGPHSWRRLLQPPEERLWSARRTAPPAPKDGFVIEAEPPPAERLALIGVRACEIAALGVHDRVFTARPYGDERYAARRAHAFVLAVNCTEPGGTCFCVSMGTGPQAESGFDLALTEVLDDGGEPRYVGTVGSPLGAEVLADVPHRDAGAAERATAERLVDEAAGRMGREMDPDGVRDLLLANLEHPQWEDVAARCLACGNCTLVCPTCFCTSVEDVTDLTGQVATHTRRWDSCFSGDFSFMHGGSVRSGVKARYRQWLTHKLATWHDQFGTSGCVGCGRCITWCPVGIDLTREVAALRADPNAVAAAGAIRDGAPE